ncbi:MAG TPA: SDR family NAD(P)-dependent oxidoreductase, partial [Solirubrobacterales bacterium]|nr:SDR family NAD(P)-dependent oxidoreductase [Solirubrobacterales bacterium]
MSVAGPGAAGTGRSAADPGAGSGRPATAAGREFAGLGGVVTGAGSGIGRAVALRIAAAGGTVLVVDVREEAAAETVALGAERGHPGRLLAHRADVTDGGQVAGYVARARSEFGDRPLAFFHNNAGVEGVHKSIAETSEAE